MKRAIDIALSLTLLLLASPLIALTAVAVRIGLGPPVLFVQRRPGLHGRSFRLVKFRTMTPARSHDGRSLPDGERMTRLGRFLRSSSLDELPELWNVLRGDMSIVGPRPLLVQYLDRYSTEQNRRHEVKPGITGLAQVSGRNALSWEERFRLDLQYVDRRSTWLDLRIIAKTIWKILVREGITEPGEDTAREFMGSDHTGRDEAVHR